VKIDALRANSLTSWKTYGGKVEDFCHSGANRTKI